MHIKSLHAPYSFKIVTELALKIKVTVTSLEAKIMYGCELPLAIFDGVPKITRPKIKAING